MKISCPNPSCGQHLSGPKALMGRCHDAPGDVDLLGRAVEEMSRRRCLDPSFNGVPRHATLLPHL